jgi:hypothetical protein
MTQALTQLFDRSALALVAVLPFAAVVFVIPSI